MDAAWVASMLDEIIERPRHADRYKKVLDPVLAAEEEKKKARRETKEEQRKRL